MLFNIRNKFIIRYQEGLSVCDISQVGGFPVILIGYRIIGISDRLVNFWQGIKIMKTRGNGLFLHWKQKESHNKIRQCFLMQEILIICIPFISDESSAMVSSD